jgi:hypothetical protein
MKNMPMAAANLKLFIPVLTRLEAPIRFDSDWNLDFGPGQSTLKTAGPTSRLYADPAIV